MENIFFLILHNDIEKLSQLDLNKAHTIKNMFGQNPLIFSCVENNTAITRLLLKHHFDLSIKDKFGYTALYYAEQNGNSDIILLFKNHLKKF